MFGLRLTPPRGVDDEQLANVRETIARALESRSLRGNRAGNQTIIDAIGVSIATFVVGISRHTSYASSMLISRSRSRNLLVLVSFERISVSLCWTSG